jgi:hypothetical protein
MYIKLGTAPRTEYMHVNAVIHTYMYCIAQVAQLSGCIQPFSYMHAWRNQNSSANRLNSVSFMHAHMHIEARMAQCTCFIQPLFIHAL